MFSDEECTVKRLGLVKQGGDRLDRREPFSPFDGMVRVVLGYEKENRRSDFRKERGTDESAIHGELGVTFPSVLSDDGIPLETTVSYMAILSEEKVVDVLLNSDLVLRVSDEMSVSSALHVVAVLASLGTEDSTIPWAECVDLSDMVDDVLREGLDVKRLTPTLKELARDFGNYLGED